MSEISRYFSRKEFACHCGCGYDTVDAELLTVLEDIREVFGLPVRILSGARCNTHNATIDHSSISSRHLVAKAADITVKSISHKSVQSYLLDKYPGKYGIGCYGTFTQIDVRTIPGRWSR